MAEIKCPTCETVFVPDETGLADIIKQVRDEQFKSEVNERERLLIAANENALQLASAEAETTLQAEQAKRDARIAQLESDIKSKDEAAEVIKQLAVTEALRKAEQEKTTLETELAKLKMEMQSKDENSQNALALELAKKDTEISELKGSFTKQESELASQLQQTKELHLLEMKAKDDEVAFHKDYKLKQSTKMLGTTLEQHCQISFERLRATAFRNAYFDNDNDSSEGTKGDFIFRDYDDDGNEILSIMFEMKNEADTTATKKKNDDFLAKLNKDREQKSCEYAVLVSQLEQDSDYYNDGIVDKFYKFPKMYVIRPQFFIPLISVLKNAALNSMQYKSELALVRSQNIDITTFESDLFNFKTGFDKSVGNARKKYDEATKGIDDAIKKLQDIKEALRLSDKHLVTSNNKLEDLSVKKLTKNNPTMAAMFEEING